MNLACPVNGGSLVQVPGNSFDAADIDEHVVAHTAEDKRGGHRPELHIGTQPFDFIPAQQFYNGVQQTIIIVKDVLNPHGSQGHGADDVRHVDRGPKELFAPDAAGDDDGHQHGQRQGNQSAYKPDQQHVVHGGAEALTAENLVEIPQPIEGPVRHTCSDAFHLEKAHQYCAAHGIDVHDKQRQQGGQAKPEDHGLIFSHFFALLSCFGYKKQAALRGAACFFTGF